MVGVAAAAVMLVLPYYFHHYKEYKEMIILAEFQAIGGDPSSVWHPLWSTSASPSAC